MLNHSMATTPSGTGTTRAGAMEVHWFSVPVTCSPPLKAHVSEASLMEIGTNEFVVIYSIDVSCCGRTWSVSRRFSEFASLHTDLGRDAPTADIFSMAHVHGPVIGAVKRFSPDLIEARTRALDDFIERACDLFQYSLRLGSFLCVASSNVDSYREKRGRKEFEPKPCSLCTAGVPCEFTEEVSAARRQNASCFSPSSHVQPDAKIHGGNGFAYLRLLRESVLLPCDSPDTVTVMETSPPSQPPSKPQAIQAAQSAAAKRHSFNYDPTAAALAVEMCRLHGAQP